MINMKIILTVTPNMTNILATIIMKGIHSTSITKRWLRITGDESFLSQVMNLVERSPAKQITHAGPGQPGRFLADNRGYYRRTHNLRSMVFFTGQSFDFAMNRTVAVMVIPVHTHWGWRFRLLFPDQPALLPLTAF